MADKAEDWQVMTAENGVQYYYNKKTKKVLWQKPEILKNEEEKVHIPSEWTEHTTADGRVFYHNATLKKSVWTKPPEMESQGLAQEQSKDKPALAISITTNIGEDGEEDEDEDSNPDPKKKELPIEDARRIFMNLLKEKNIEPSMKWNQIHETLKKDERYKVLSKISEKKKVLGNYIAQIKKNERTQARTKLEQDRANYKQMLSEFKNLTSDSKYSSVLQYFFNDSRYKAIDMKERENLFQDYLDELFEREKEDLKRHRKAMVSKMKEHFLDIPMINSSTKWEDACQLLKYNAVWQELHEADRIEAFSEYVLAKDRDEEAERKKKRLILERKNREQFRELLREKISNDEFTFKTKWRHFVKKNRDDVRLLNMFKQSGSSPRDLFHDFRQKLVEKNKVIKEEFKKILSKHVADFSINIDPIKFKKILLKYEEFQNFEGSENSNSFDYYANYLLDKYKKRIKKAKNKYVQLVADRFPDMTSETTFEAIQSKVQESLQDTAYLSCLSDVDRKEIASGLQARLRSGETLDQIVPERKKKKDDKKDKKVKKNDSDEKKENHVKTETAKIEDKKTPDMNISKRKPEKESVKSPKKSDRKNSSSSQSDISKQRSRTRSKTKRRRNRDRLSSSGEGRSNEDGPEEGEVTEIPKHLRKIMKKRGSRRRSTSSYSHSYKSKSSPSESLDATKEDNQPKAEQDKMPAA